MTFPRRRPPTAGNRRVWLAALATLAVPVLSDPARAQVMERHLPPAEAPQTQALPTPQEPGLITDDRSLGAALTSIVLIGPTSAVVSGRPEPGVSIHDVPRMDQKGPRAALRRFLGQTLSRKLISEVETAVVEQYRAMGYPFVQVSTPEQEIDQGVLQIRVVEFHIGKIEIAGASAGEAKHIAGLIRAEVGQPINSPRLLQDFDWLSRYPYRTVTPAFTPGAGLGESDVDLAVKNISPPWQVYAGYQNSDSPLTGPDRYFMGASLGLAALNDTVISAQVTGSPDFWAQHGDLFSVPNPQYESAAARITAPTLPRQDIEITANAVESNETNDAGIFPLQIRQQTLEGSAAYRSALSNFVDLPGDVAVGLEAVHQNRYTTTTLFGVTIPLVSISMDVFQAFGEWSYRWSDPYGHSSIDAKVHGSPGGLTADNSPLAYAIYTDGRATSPSYVYGGFDFNRWSALPWGLSLVSEVSGQYASGSLPDPEQIAIGGLTAVRGYSLDDGAFDNGVYARNELHAPTVPTVGKGAYALTFTPMTFIDAGYGRNDGSAPGVPTSLAIASVGVGTGVQIGPFVAGQVTASYPLADSRYTRQGEWRLDAAVTIAY